MSELNEAVKAAMVQMLIKFNNRLNKSQMEPESKLADWAQYLAFERKFKVSQVAVALESLMNSNTKYMPSAYEIADALKPKSISSDDVGNFVANEVIQKVIEFGIYRLDQAFQALSEVSKNTIGHNTYLLREVANSDEDSLPSIRAQIRGLAKASTESNKVENHNEKLAAIGIVDKNVITFKRPEFQSIDFSGYLPDGDLA